MKKNIKKSVLDAHIAKKEFEKLLDRQTDVILRSVHDIVDDRYRKLDSRLSKLEREVSRLVSTLEHYMKKTEDLEMEFTMMKERLRRVEEKIGITY